MTNSPNITRTIASRTGFSLEHTQNELSMFQIDFLSGTLEKTQEFSHVFNVGHSQQMVVNPRFDFDCENVECVHCLSIEK